MTSRHRYIGVGVSTRQTGSIMMSDLFPLVSLYRSQSDGRILGRGDMHPSVFLPYHPTQWTDFSVLLPNSMHHGFLDQGYPASWGVNTAPTQPWWKDSGRLLYHSPVNFARCEAGTNRLFV
ncbi:hypothetical protein AFLA70_60g003890 [Aspergillus flavus AF70]|nr:hypothetical protein AFLA70_60g003890 [Aspergillus flavus AF70]